MSPKEETAQTPAWRIKFSQSNKQQQQITKNKTKKETEISLVQGNVTQMQPTFNTYFK